MFTGNANHEETANPSAHNIHHRFRHRSESLYLTTIPNPTDIQKQLSNTATSITIAGTTAIFGLLDDDDKNNRDV
jgi:hypothetical protein